MELYYPIVLDGATGTQLQKRGYDGGIAAEKWVLEHPEAIKDIQSRYFSAGSQIVYAPTFGANQIKLEENKIFGQVESYNNQLVSISKEVAEGKGYVAGDISPLGKFLKPFSEMSFQQMVDIYSQQAKALEESGVDLFVIETMMSIPEARAAVLAVKSVSNKPILVTFTSNAQGKTISGSDIEAALEILQSMGVTAFGLNCSLGPKQMVSLIEVLAKYTQIPLIAKANAGLPVVENGQTVYRCDPSEYTEAMDLLAANYVGLFGGCCGSDETHIQAIAQKCQSLKVAKPKKREDGRLYLASEKKLFVLDNTIQIDKVIVCDEELGESIEESESETLMIQVSDGNQLEYFEENQYLINKPLVIECDDYDLLDQLLAMYQGKCMVISKLDKGQLLVLKEKYGCIY